MSPSYDPIDPEIVMAINEQIHTGLRKYIGMPRDDTAIALMKKKIAKEIQRVQPKMADTIVKYLTIQSHPTNIKCVAFGLTDNAPLWLRETFIEMGWIGQAEPVYEENNSG